MCFYRPNKINEQQVLNLGDYCCIKPKDVLKYISLNELQY